MSQLCLDQAPKPFGWLSGSWGPDNWPRTLELDYGTEGELREVRFVIPVTTTNPPEDYEYRRSVDDELHRFGNEERLADFSMERVNGEGPEIRPVLRLTRIPLDDGTVVVDVEGTVYGLSQFGEDFRTRLAP